MTGSRVARDVLMLPDPRDPSQPPDRWQDPGLLGYLDRVRLPWGEPVRRVVRAVLARLLPDPPGPLVEIGAGGGQLRRTRLAVTSPLARRVPRRSVSSSSRSPPMAMPPPTSTATLAARIPQQFVPLLERFLIGQSIESQPGS